MENWKSKKKVWLELKFLSGNTAIISGNTFQNVLLIGCCVGCCNFIGSNLLAKSEADLLWKYPGEIYSVNLRSLRSTIIFIFKKLGCINVVV